MSTLRVSNIEAKADVSSPSVHEKIKVTNSEGDVLVHIDGATSGISTVGINTTVKTFDVDSNQNIDFVGNLTAANITVTGTLSYDDVTNIDSVGVVTARSGLEVTSGGLQVVAGNVGIDQANPTNKLEVEGSASVARFVGNRTDALGPRLSLAKSRGSTSGSATIVQDGDEIGQIMFKGADGTDADSTGAAIIGLVDGTPGVNDMPGALTFLTTNDGTNSPTERLRITSAGNVGIGLTNPDWHLDIKSTSVNAVVRLKSSGSTNGGQLQVNSDDLILRNRDAGNLQLWTNDTERLRIASNGTTTVGPQYDQVKIEPGNGTYDGEATTLSVDGRTNDGNRVALKVDRYLSGTSATTKFSVKYDGTIFSATGMQASSINLQSSSTNSWFQTGASYGGIDYVWAAKDSSANVWHSGLQTDGDLLLGGNITGTSYIQLNGSTGNATFIGKVDIGNQYTGGEIFKLGKSSGTSYTGYYNGGTAHGFIGHADQLVTGGSGTDFAIRSTNELLFATDGANERLRINSAGELLIGEIDSPTDEGISGATRCKIGMSFGNSTGNYIEMGGTSRNANGFSKLAVMRHGYWGGSREVASIGFLTSSSSGGAGRGTGNFIVYTGTSGNGDGGNSGDNLSIERTRVDHEGRFYVNTVNANNWSQSNNGPNNDNANGSNPSGNMCFRTSEGALVIANDADSGYSAIYINKYEWNSGDDNRWINFYLNGAGKDSITWNGSNIVYGNNSDYRIKTNIRSYTGGINLVKQIQVRQYDYIETERGTDHVGFIAHELQEVLPDAVSGEKDAMRIEEETGEEVMDIQNVDYGRVTPILTAALKEAIAKIEALEARITALEG